MMFLIKGTFWFTMALVVLSFFGSTGNTTKVSDNGTLDVADAVTAASGAYQYLAKICVERPEVCEKGAETLTAVGARARDGAMVAFQILDSHLNKASTEQTADLSQPMPPMPTAASASAPLLTGAIPTTGAIPVPMKKPLAR